MPSDPTRPEQPVYRPSRGGMDPSTKRLATVAGSIGAILVALVGGWSLTNHAGGGIPVIEAPVGPERVKPANPGGLQLMGAEPPSAAADNGATALAPGPETPDPQALQAELNRAHNTDEPTPAAPAARPTPASILPDAIPPAIAIPARTPATSVPASAPAVPAPNALPPTVPNPLAHDDTGSRVEVQLAALDSQTAAEAEWQRLARKTPSLFADRRPLIVEASRDGKTFFRLRTGGFASIADATGFCERSRQAGAACTIAAF